MKGKKFLNTFYEIIVTCFIPFIVVIFIEFVLKLGMGPSVERLSFFLPVYASIIAICSYVWIRKGIIFAFFPIILFTVIISIFYKGEITMGRRLLDFFLSLVFLSSASIISYAISKVIREYRSSYSFAILQFFVGLFVFICGMFIVHFISYFISHQMTMFQSIISGIGKGLLLGSGVIIVIIMLAQKTD